MIVVHHLNNSRSQRVLWMLEELGVRYEVKRYERDKTTMLAPRELKAIHPLGKSPVITDGDITVAETGAIIEYILDRYGEGRLIPPPRTAERLRFVYWLHYAEGSAVTPLLLKLVFTRMPLSAKGLVKGIVQRIAKEGEARVADPQIAMHVDYWDNELSKAEWFAGQEFTAADIMMSFPLEAAAHRAGARARPMVAAFLDRIHARPAYQKALQTGGPYDYA